MFFSSSSASSIKIEREKEWVEWPMVESKRLSDERMGIVEVGFKAEKLLNENRGIPGA